MSTSHTPVDNTAVNPLSPRGAGFRKLFITGVFGWLLGIVALFAASWVFSKPEAVAVAVMWTVSRIWIAFAAGLALMVAVGLLTKAPLAKPLLAYILPAALLAALAGICLLIFPDAGFRVDILNYLPVVWVFYLFSGLWMALRRRDDGAFQQAVLPSLVGGLIILGFVAVPAFASDAFIYQSAFQLTGKEPKIENGALTFDGELEISKAGNYEFSAPRYILITEEEGEAGFELGEIQWGAAGTPKEGAIGKFPLRITWKKGLVVDPSGELSPIDEYVSLEVHRPDQAGKLIYTVDARDEPAP